MSSDDEIATQPPDRRSQTVTNVPDEAVEAMAELLCQELLFETPGHGCGGFCQAVGRYGPLARKALAAAAPFLADGTGVLEGWQPIETAPKDGTEILLYGRCERDGHYYAADRNVGWWQAECWQARDLPIDPTHWQPLPVAPLKAEG